MKKYTRRNTKEGDLEEPIRKILEKTYGYTHRQVYALAYRVMNRRKHSKQDNKGLYLLFSDKPKIISAPIKKL